MTVASKVASFALGVADPAKHWPFSQAKFASMCSFFFNETNINMSRLNEAPYSGFASLPVDDRPLLHFKIDALYP